MEIRLIKKEIEEIYFWHQNAIFPQWVANISETSLLLHRPDGYWMITIPNDIEDLRKATEFWRKCVERTKNPYPQKA